MLLHKSCNELLYNFHSCNVCCSLWSLTIHPYYSLLLLFVCFCIYCVLLIYVNFIIHKRKYTICIFRWFWRKKLKPHTHNKHNTIKIYYRRLHDYIRCILYVGDVSQIMSMAQNCATSHKTKQKTNKNNRKIHNIC